MTFRKLSCVLLACLTVLAVMLTAVSCNNNNQENESGTGLQIGTVADGTGTGAADPSADTGDASTDPAKNNQTADPVQNDYPQDPVDSFTAASKKIVVVAARATVRSAPVVNGENGVLWPAEGTELTVTGESTNWYRITYQDQPAYITKTVAQDVAALALDTFKAMSVTATISGGSVNVRCVPSADSDYSIRGALKDGDTISVLGVSADGKWYKVSYTHQVTNADGTTAEVTSEYYITSNADYVKLPEAATTAETETANS